MNTPLHHQSLRQLSELLEKGAVSSVELVQYFYDRIQASNAHQQLNCFIEPSFETIKQKALAQAKHQDERRHKKQHHPLAGIPLAHKDIFCTKGIGTTCGSRTLESFVPPYDATVVARLAQAGMVTIAKCNMDEFAMGSSNETSYFGPVQNPWDTSKVPGGSSGGSAVAVAARLAPAATGTDTGGSIRQPAALCGVSGLKPTYGRVSRYGQIAFASSLDQAGVFTTTAEDAAMLLTLIAGKDPQDQTCSTIPSDDYTSTLQQPLTNKKIGFVPAYLEAAQPPVAAVIEQALKQLEAQGATLVPITMTHHQLAVSVYQIIASAECSSNLSRYDGIRYGHRSTKADTVEELITNSRTEGFGTEVKRRILLGTHVLSSGYYDAYYLAAKKLQQKIKEDFAHAFQTVEVLATPTSPTVAFALGEKLNNPIDMYFADVLTVAANLAELPALSIPAGTAQNLPVGLQLTAPAFCEARLLATAHQFQQHTTHHTHIPENYQ